MAELEPDRVPVLTAERSEIEGSGTRIRGLRPLPQNGWARSSLPIWRGRRPMIDLVTGQLRLPEPWPLKLGEPDPNGVEAGAEGQDDVASAVFGESISAIDGPLYLPTSAERIDVVIATLVRAGKSAVVQLPLEDARALERSFKQELPDKGPEIVLVLDPLSCLGSPHLNAALDAAVQNFEGLSGSAETVLLLPLLAGLWSNSELDAVTSRGASLAFSALVPVAASALPRVLQRFIKDRIDDGSGLSEEQCLGLFHSRAHRRRDVAQRIAAAGGRWWFEPMISVHRGRRIGQNRFVAAQLLLIAELADWLGEGTGLVEGHRQAARRIDEFDYDLAALIVEGNLRVLDWLDGRVRNTLLEWHEQRPEFTGVPPGLARRRRAFVADSR